MATKRAKPISTKTSNAKAQPVSVDRISKLPDPIIHRILSLVPTIDVVRMSLLSKRWRRVWCSVPALNFSDSDRTKYFPCRGIVGLYTFFNNCLKHRKAASHYVSDAVVTRFQLSVECPRGTAAMDKFLAFAVQSNAEEIDLCVKHRMKYRLPEAVFNIRSLCVLKLDSLVFDDSYSEISLPALKHLSLIMVDELCDELLNDLISGCPSLVKFFLDYTDNTVTVKPPISITSSTLKFLEIIIWDIEQIHVEAKNLVSLKYDGRYKNLDISACTAIKNLSLLTNWIDDQPLEDLICGLPDLENLTLGKFNMLTYNRIPGQNLKSFRLKSSSYYPFDLTIEAQDLTSFRYKGYTPSIEFQLRVLPGIVRSEEPEEELDKVP